MNIVTFLAKNGLKSTLLIFKVFYCTHKVPSEIKLFLTMLGSMFSLGSKFLPFFNKKIWEILEKMCFSSVVFTNLQILRQNSSKFQNHKYGKKLK